MLGFRALIWIFPLLLLVRKGDGSNAVIQELRQIKETLRQSEAADQQQRAYISRLAENLQALTASMERYVGLLEDGQPQDEEGLGSCSVQLALIQNKLTGFQNSVTEQFAEIKSSSTDQQLNPTVTPDDDNSCVPFHLANPSFETQGESWQSYGRGFEYSNETASHGSKSAVVQHGGVYQVLVFPPGTRSFKIAADSTIREISANLRNTDNYSLYCDVKRQDNTWRFGQNVLFDVDNPDWQTATLVVTETKDIKEAWCYGMFRYYPRSKRAFFDNFRVWTGTTPCS